MFVATLAACAPAGARLAPLRLPFPAETLRVDTLAAGLVHYDIWSSRGPWAIQVLDADRAACWSAVSLRAGGRELVRDLVQALADTSRAMVGGGVNADFFVLATGEPLGLSVSGGRVVTPGTGRAALGFDSAGTPSIGVSGARGVITGRDTIVPMEAVGGLPILLRDSALADNLDSVGGARFAPVRHPRTAVGVASGGRRLLLVTVDGRQVPFSDGMTLRELAQLMKVLGARDAINLDGGGSTTMVINRGGVMGTLNRPSDAAGERTVANALALVRRACTWRR